jgi:cyclic pyranopterin phosphate synthase
LRSLVRANVSEDDLANAIGHIWQQRADRYSELRSQMPVDQDASVKRVEMSYIGG